MQPRLSVILSCYNNESTLNRAIDSILAQSFTDWVMICCDDGSTDCSYSILEKYKKEYPDKFIVIHNENNMKLGYSLNCCLEHVNTEYVARMDADDESLPERFKKQIAFLDSNPDLMVCGTQIRVINDLSGMEYVSKIEEKPDKYTRHKRTPFNHATIMCHKEMYDILGGYSEDKSTVRCEDKDLWFRFFDRELKGENILEPLYRTHENKEHIYRTTLASRKNSLFTEWKGYRLLGYPWYWYYKPVMNFCKGFVPRELMVMYYKRFRK